MCRNKLRAGASFGIAIISFLGFTPLGAQEHPGDKVPGEEGEYFLTDPAVVEAELGRTGRNNVRSLAKVFDTAGMNMTLDESPEVCSAVLEHAANVYASVFTLDDQKSWAYAKKCGSSSKSRNTAIDIIVYELPIGFESGESKQKQWCDENESLKTRTQAYQRIENQVMGLAIQNWGQCIDAYRNGLITRVNVSNTDRVFQIKVKNGTNADQSITKLNVLSDEDDGLECDSTVPPKVTIKPNDYANFVCSRSFVEVNRQGKKFEVLPGGTITFSNSVTPFFYSFNEKFRKDAVPKPDEPRKIMISLTGSHIGTKAYWAGGARHQVQYCGPNPIDAAREGYDLIFSGKREVRAWGRGLCGKPPMCDSHNEFCNELYYGTACYINKEWHDHYKQQVAEKGWEYSLPQVCSP